ncbi:MAG: hypothetical protein Q9212_004295 [Teloschistes hypoglaucus]
MPSISGLFIAFAGFGPAILAAPAAGHDPSSKFVATAPKTFARASADVVSSHVLELNRMRVSGSDVLRHDKVLEKGDLLNGTVGLAELRPFKDILYYADITFGTETLQAVVDTGSSDTWLVETGFRCATVQGRTPIPEETCHFGPLYSTSPTFKQIPGQNFNILYADGESLSGIVGTEDVTLAGITVKNQEIALVDYAAWSGDNFTSGVIGLAFPSITSSFNGSDPLKDTPADALEYSPLFTSMYQQGKVAPVFSLAIARGEESGGFLALGGLPPVQHDAYFASTPILPSLRRPGNTNAAQSKLQYYTVTLEGVHYQDTFEKVNVRADVDSGTSLIFLPSRLASKINQLFDPPAQYDIYSGEYQISCDAKPPDFGILVGGHTFSINPKDLVVKTQNNGGCITGITNGGLNHPAVLGDVFLRNVLAVFDIGAGQMRFSGRELY